ncbi:MAG: anti-sigma F factor antagonist [Candidatus Alkaliphilus sp. MAG34]|nr:anti-sigma F factor antagonist [Clostridiales bacterium]
MQLQYEVVGNTLIVKFNGELDHHVAKDIRTEIDETINRRKTRNLILDLNNMSFMDSSGVGVIIGRYKRIKELGGKVSVIHVTAQIDKIFTLAGLYNIVGKHKDKNKALNCM